MPKKHRVMTAAERKRYARIRARIAASRGILADDDSDSDDNDDKDTTVTKPDQEPDGDEDGPDTDNDGDGTDTDDDEKKEKESEHKKAMARRRRACLRAMERRRSARITAMRKKALDTTDDETLSDDLTKSDEKPSGVSGKPQPESNSGEDKAKHQDDNANQQDAVEAAQDAILAAYNLYDAQVVHNVVAPTAHKASVAAEYVKKYSSAQMKFAAEQLNKVGTAKKVAGNVRVTRKSGSINDAISGMGDDISSSCLFY